MKLTNKLIFLILIVALVLFLISGCAKSNKDLKQAEDSVEIKDKPSVQETAKEPSLPAATASAETIKTCSESNGDICDSSEVCSGNWLDVSDSFSCCSQKCASSTNNENALSIETFDLETENEEIGDVI
jgi:hypothetical protein